MSEFYRFDNDEFDLFYQTHQKEGKIILEKILFFQGNYVSKGIGTVSNIPETWRPITREEFENASERANIRETVRTLKRIGT